MFKIVKLLRRLPQSVIDYYAAPSTLVIQTVIVILALTLFGCSTNPPVVLPAVNPPASLLVEPQALPPLEPQAGSESVTEPDLILYTQSIIFNYNELKAQLKALIEWHRRVAKETQ
jgi:hypothetical protein